MNRVALRTAFFLMAEKGTLKRKHAAALISFLRWKKDPSLPPPTEYENMLLEGMLQVLRLEGTTNRVMKLNKVAWRCEITDDPSVQPPFPVEPLSDD